MEKLDVFLSWSGEQSRIVAEALKDWLPQVLDESINPWFSKTNIQAGSISILAIGLSLEASGIGILCVTDENKTAPWIMFEAGAISKHLEKSLVIPYLIDLDEDELVGPLSHFQAKKATPEGTFEILSTINQEMAQQISAPILEKRFNVFWPQLEARIREASGAPSKHLGGWWVYSLIAETPEGFKDTLGYFCMKHSHERAVINEGRAFWVKGSRLYHRGEWKADSIWIHDNMIRLIYAMSSVTPIEDITDYEGYLELKSSQLKPILGESSWVGSFHDLKTRSTIKGYVYAERLAPLPRLYSNDLKDCLRKKKNPLLNRVRSFYPDISYAPQPASR